MPDVYLRSVPSDPDRDDVRLYGPGSSFPTQYPGLRIWHSGAVVSLCVVATGDAPTGLGGQPRIYMDGVVRALYLVATSDPDASPVRMRVGGVTRAVRRLT